MMEIIFIYKGISPFLQGGKVKNNAFNFFKILNEANKSFIHIFNYFHPQK